MGEGGEFAVCGFGLAGRSQVRVASAAMVLMGKYHPQN